MKLGTANVRTLKEGCSDSGLSDKIELLSAQLKDKNYDVLAVQESRARLDRISTFGSITRLVSAATHGQGGVELWVNAEGPLSQGPLGPLKATHFHVQASSSTFLVANCDHPLLQCTFVIAYAPQGGRSQSEIDEWWSSFSQLLVPLVGKEVVLMGDFNAHVGAVETLGIGSFGWATENQACGHFRSLIDDHALCVPSTFAHFHAGPTITFRSASGGSSRVDYIAVPHAWVSGIQSSFVDIEFDLLSGDYDHFVVALELEMSITPCSGVNRPRRPLYDRQAARAHPDLLRRMIHSIPPVAWGVGLDQHWEVIEKHCSAFLKRHFPLPKRHVRQEYFSPKTWDLLCHRKDVAIQVRDADTRISRWQLLRFFGLWRAAGKSASTPSEASSLALAHCYQERALLLWSRAKLDVLFRASRKQDLVLYRTHCALDFRHTVSTGNPALMFQALRPKRPVNRDKGFKVSRPLPALDLSETNPFENTRRRYLRVWELHFASIESSRLADREEFMDFARSQQTLTLVPGFSLAEVPCVLDFERAIRGLSWKKAPGFDGLGAECWQSDMEGCRRHIYALFLKATARRFLPIQFRGGFLIPLFKNRGSMSDPASFRGILLQNTCAKVFAKTWRTQLAAHLDRQAAPLQLGCRKGLGVMCAHLPLRLHLDSCMATGQSMAVIFIDVKAAYYSVVKELYNAHPPCNSEKFLAALFHRLRLPPEALADFVDYVGQTCLTEDAGINETLSAMIQCTLEKSWYQLPTSPDLYAPATGTRPGDPLADVLFGFAMADVLGEVYHYMAMHREVLQLPDDYPFGTTWADDTCILLGGDAVTLESRVGIAFSAIQEAFTKRGLVLSYGPHKTAVIIAFRGKDGKWCHKRLFSQETPCLKCCLEHSPPVDIQVYFNYKHLGSIVDASGSLMPEIKARAGKALHAVRPLVSSCLGSDKIPLARRRQILHSLGLSVLVHNVGTWRKLTVGEAEAWSAAIWKIYCCVIPRKHAETHPHISVEYAAYEAGYFLPEAVLHVNRLRLLGQMLRYPDESLVDIINDNWQKCGVTSWWVCVQEAILWLRDVSGGGRHLDELLEITTPAQLLSPRPSLATSITKAIRKACKLNLQYLRQWLDLTAADETMTTTLQAHGWEIPQRQPLTTSRAGCPSCGKYFKDEAALATHRFKAHGLRVASRRFAPGSTCSACGKNFITRPRLVIHLQYSSRRCLPWLLTNMKPIDESLALQLDLADAAVTLEERRSGIRSAASRMPHHRGGYQSVPQVPLAPLEVRARPIIEGLAAPTEGQLDFLERWRSFDGCWPLDDRQWLLFAAELIEMVKSSPYGCYQSFSGRATELLDEVAWRQDDFEVVMELQDRLASILHAYVPHRQPPREPHRSREERLRDWEADLGALPVWMGLRDPSKRPRWDAPGSIDWPFRMARLEHKWQTELHEWRAPEGSVPRQAFPTEVFYVVLYSGHRREGDLASQVWMVDYGLRKVWPLCLDLCLDPVGGDLLNPETLQFWRRQILDHRVVGFHASPPCETYSEARYLPPPEGKDRPRPLRNWAHPWGLPGLDPREVRQLTTGNALFFIAVLMMVWTVCSGGCGTLEHPAGRSPAEGRFTVWYSAFLGRLGGHCECDQFTFNQGPLGQVSLKPTTFLLLRMPAFPRIIRSLSTFSGPFRSLQGQENGQWATSQAKEFPPALCKAIALSLQVFLLARPGASTHSSLPWPANLPDCTWRPFDRYMLAGDFGGTVMGPDFWG